MNNWREISYPIPVAGIEPLSMVDYPGKLSAVLFLQGCLWACPYCHNPSLQKIGVDESVMRPWSEVSLFLEKRRNILDAVVFSGGEPTIHKNLTKMMSYVKELGYKVGLHTNGCNPDMVTTILSLEVVDWIGIDIKSPSWMYKGITKSNIPVSNVYDSISQIVKSGIEFEVRCTLYRSLLDWDVFDCMGYDMRRLGVPFVKIQPCRDENREDLISKEELCGYQTRMNKLLK